MKAGKMAFTALFSALLIACSSSPDTREAGPPTDPTNPTNPTDPTDPTDPIPVASIDTLPEQKYRTIVIDQKTIDLNYGDPALPPGVSIKAIIDGKEGQYNFSDLPNGRKNLSIVERDKDTNALIRSGTLLVYQQPYSVVVGKTWMQYPSKPDELKLLQVRDILGYLTPNNTILELGGQKATYHYSGIVFARAAQEATFNYTIDFGTQKGSGSIVGLDYTGKINLQEGAITPSNATIKGIAYFEGIPASAQGAQYDLSFFGPDAEEVIGNVYDRSTYKSLENSEIIFAGKRK